jgi:hypothetical protein
VSRPEGVYLQDNGWEKPEQKSMSNRACRGVTQMYKGQIGPQAGLK